MIVKLGAMRRRTCLGAMSTSGVVPAPAVVTLSRITSSHPGIKLKAAIGAVRVAPGTTHAAVHTLTYSICEKANPANPAEATVTFDRTGRGQEAAFHT